MDLYSVDFVTSLNRAECASRRENRKDFRRRLKIEREGLPSVRSVVDHLIDLLGWIAYWLASVGNLQEDAGSNPGGAKVMNRNVLCSIMFEQINK